MGIITVCKNCSNRYPACHDYCPAYLEQKAKYANYKKSSKYIQDKNNLEYYTALSIRIDKQKRNKRRK